MPTRGQGQATRASPAAWLWLAVLLLCDCRERDAKPGAAPAPPGAPATTRVAPPQATVVFQPMFVWADGTTTLQGTGFFAAAPGGRVAAVTSAQFVSKDGPRLLEARWLNVRTGVTAATFSSSWGTPGDGGRDEPSLDLRSDYLLLPATKAPERTAVLEFDTRPKPSPGERIHFPNKDESAEAGHTWLEGAVVEADEKFVTVRLDQRIPVQSQTGSPLLSQATGKVIGILSRARPDGDQTMLTLAPAAGMVAALAAQPATPRPLRDVTGRAAGQGTPQAAAARGAPGSSAFEKKEIVRLTEAAAKAVRDAAGAQKADLSKTAYLRAGVKPKAGGGFDYLLDVTQQVNPRVDLLSVSQGIRIVVDRRDAPYLSGTTIDYRTGPTTGFVFNNPNAKPPPAE